MGSEQVPLLRPQVSGRAVQVEAIVVSYATIGICEI